MNVLWCCFNVVILGVCIAVARELMQRRTTVRLNIATPLIVRLPDGRTIATETIDMSNGGAGIRLAGQIDLAPEAMVHLAFPQSPKPNALHATVVSLEDSELRVRFDDLSIAEQEVLTLAALLARRFLAWMGRVPRKRQGASLARPHLQDFHARPLGHLLSLFGRDDLAARRKSNPLSIAPSGMILLLAGLLILGAPSTHAQSPLPASNSANAARPANAASTTNSASPTLPITPPAPLTPLSYPANITTHSPSPTPARRRSSCTPSIAATTSTSRCRSRMSPAPQPFTSITHFLRRLFRN